MNPVTSGQTDFFVVAQVTALSGEAGFLKLKLFSDFYEKFRDSKSFFVDFFGNKKELPVDEIKGKAGDISVKFSAFSTREEAKILLNKYLYIPGTHAAELPENEHYIHDLIGSSVYKNGGLFGKIKDVYTLKTNDVYVIEKVNGDEYLLPALNEYIDKFSAGEKMMILKSGDEFYDDED